MDDLPVGTFVLVTRTTPRWDSHDLRRQSGMALGYTAAGFLLKEITLGHPLVLLRVIRNDLTCLGKFETSVIETITGPYLVTANSTYVIHKAHLKVILDEL